MHSKVNVVSWYLFTILEFVLLYFGLRGNQLAWNIFVFMFVWFGTIVLVLVAMSAPRIPRRLHNTIAAYTDITIACVLAAFGHWFYAAIIITQMMCEQSLYIPKQSQASLEEEVKILREQKQDMLATLDRVESFAKYWRSEYAKACTLLKTRVEASRLDEANARIAELERENAKLKITLAS